MLKTQYHHRYELEKRHYKEVGLAARPKDGKVIGDQTIEDLDGPWNESEGLQGLDSTRIQIIVGLEEVSRCEVDQDLCSLIEVLHTEHGQERTVIFAIQLVTSANYGDLIPAR